MMIEININNNNGSRCQKLTVNCLSPYFQALCISVCLNLRNASPLNVNHVSFFPPSPEPFAHRFNGLGAQLSSSSCYRVQFES